jgi:general secretion pathway protein K
LTQHVWPVAEKDVNDVTLEQRQHGFVLVAVIWLAGLIAAITTGFAVKVRIDAMTASNIVHNTQAELIADGMARLTAWRLATDTVPHIADSSPMRCRWNKAALVEVRIQDQAGLADLNVLPPAFFEEFIKGLGVDTISAKQIAAAMMDFRDVDGVAQLGGGEGVSYVNRSYGPKNAPFEAVEELEQVPGITEMLYRTLLPLVTVHAAQPGIDYQTAPAALRGAFNEAPNGEFNGRLAKYTAASQARAFGIDVRVTLYSGAQFRRLALAVILRQPERPFTFLTWQRGGDWSGETAVQPASNACFN